MKKLLSIATLFAIALSACGQAQPSSQNTPTPNASTATESITSSESADTNVSLDGDMIDTAPEQPVPTPTKPQEETKPKPTTPTPTPTTPAPDAPAPAPAPAPTPAPLVITMQTDNFFFKPSSITAKLNQKVTINFANSGVHSFDIDELGVHKSLSGASGSITFTPTKKGTFRFYCNVGSHAQAGMVGTITVTD